MTLPGEVKQLSQTLPRKKLVKIGAKVAGYGRCFTFQRPEMAVSTDLFREIQSRIDALRARPAPA
ncbi:MAG: hypothetical protein O7I42_21860 [Alphaproteobacteria bacterium]|nr:hypothetical protein [Alphaproteobacteria bacterium]